MITIPKINGYIIKGVGEEGEKVFFESGREVLDALNFSDCYTYDVYYWCSKDKEYKPVIYSGSRNVPIDASHMPATVETENDKTIFSGLVEIH